MGTEGNFLKLVKGMYEKPTANAILNDEKSECVAPNFRNKGKNARSPPFCSTVYWRLQPGQWGKKKKSIKGIWIGKEEVKLDLYADDMILYIENPKESMKNLELLSYISNLARSKINTQKSVVFLYISFKQSKIEWRKFPPQ